MANGTSITAITQSSAIAPEIDHTARTFEVMRIRARDLLQRRVSAFRFNSLVKTDVAIGILDVVAWFHAQAAFYHDRRRRNSLLITADTRESMVILTRAQGYRMHPATSASVALTATPLPTQAVPIALPAGTIVQAGDLFFELVNEAQIPAGVTSWPDGTTDDLVVVSEGRTISEPKVSDGSVFQRFELGQPGTIEGSVRVTILGEEWEEVPSLVFVDGDRAGRDSFVGDGLDGQVYVLRLLNAVVNPEDEDGLVVLVQPAGQTSEAAVRWQQVSDFTGAPQEFRVTQDLDGTTRINFGTALAGAAPGDLSTITVYYLIVGAQKRYQLTYDADDRATIRFGDGVFGVIPPNGATINVAYRTGGGVRGNVDIDTINTVIQGTLPNGGRVPVRVRNLEAGRGGNAPETVEHARFFAPRFAVSNGRAVRGSDWVAQAATFVDPVFGAPAHAAAFLKQKIPELNTVQVALWARDVDGNLTTPNTPLKVAVKKHLDTKRTFTTTVEVIDGKVILLNIEADIILVQGAVRAAVFANLRAAITDFFQSAFVLPGQDVSISKLYNVFADVTGVDSAEITNITGSTSANIQIGVGDGTTTLFSGNFVLREGTAVVPRSLTVLDTDGSQQAVDDGEGAFTGDNDNTIPAGNTGNQVIYDSGAFSIQFAAAPPVGSPVIASALLESFFARVESLGTSDGNVQNLNGATDFFPVVKRSPRGLWSGDQVRIVDGFQIGSTTQMAGRFPRGVTPTTLTIRDNTAIITVVGFGSGAGDTIGYTRLNGSPAAITEGVDFAAITDNDTTAENIRLALVANGLNAMRVGAVVTISSPITALSTSDATAWTATPPQVVTDNGVGVLLQSAVPVGSINYNTGDAAWAWNTLPVPVQRATWETDTVNIRLPADLVPLEPGRLFVWAGFDADGVQVLGGGQLLAADDGTGVAFGNVDVAETRQILYEVGDVLFTWDTTPPPAPGTGPTFPVTLVPAPDGVTKTFAFTTGADLSRTGNGGEGRLKFQLSDLSTPGVAFADAYDNFNGGIHGPDIDDEGANSIAYPTGSGNITFATPPAATAPTTFLAKIVNVAVFLYSGWVFRVPSVPGPGLDKGLFADQTGRLWGPPGIGSANPFPTDRLDHLRGRFLAELAGSPVAAGRELQLTYDSLTGIPPALNIPIQDDQIATLGQIRLTEKPPEIGFGGA